jgi:hypothetical protein
MPANQYSIWGIIRVGSDNDYRKQRTFKEFQRDLAAFLWPSDRVNDCSYVAYYMRLLKVSIQIASPPQTPTSCIISGELHKGPEYTHRIKYVQGQGKR